MNGSMIDPVTGIDETGMGVAYGGSSASGLSYGSMLSGGGGILAGIGALEEGEAAYQAGQNQRIALEYSAKIAEQNAGQSRAAAQRDRMETVRQTGLLKSRIIALAAASGVGVSDPGLINLIANQAGYGALKEATDMYQGEEKARQFRMKAATLRYEGVLAEQAGKQRRDASRIKALGDFAMAAVSFA